jgi:hypothetical protein
VNGKTALILVIVILLGIIGFALFFNNGKISIPGMSESASITGSFDVNGVIPDDATVTLTQKELGGSGGAKVVASGLALSDGDTWSFNGATKGQTYILKAEVVVNGKVMASSSLITITAPADDESLALNLPAENQNKNAVISGNIVVNGYIPQGATIKVQGRRLGETNFNTIASNLTGQARQFMSYTTAVAGRTYQVQAELVNASGNTIGSSDTLTVTAPAVNEKLTINSSATAPSTTTPTSNGGSSSQNQGSSVLSGSINFNGSAPANSRIVVFAQAAGASSNQVIANNVSPTNAATWSWNGAQAGTWYTVVAVLKQAQGNGTDKDIADSQTLQVAAPATSIVFNINSGMSLSAPGANITVTCQTFNDGPNQNNWSVNVNYQAIPGAQSYWLQIGTSSGGNQTQNTTVNSSGGNNQSIGATLNNNVTYYAQYAYANVANVPVGGSQYSGFSPSVPIQCGN